MNGRSGSRERVSSQRPEFESLADIATNNIKLKAATLKIKSKNYLLYIENRLLQRERSFMFSGMTQ